MCVCHLSKENYSSWEDDAGSETLDMHAGRQTTVWFLRTQTRLNVVAHL